MKKLLLLASSLLLAAVSFASSHTEKSTNMDQLNDLSIIMPSYDKYSELWPANFEMLFKYWPSLNAKYKNIPIYLMSNEEKFNHPRVTNILVGDADKGWSSNFLKALESVKTKYVLITLDDYIINYPVNEKRLAQILQFMKDTNAAYAELVVDTPLLDGPPVKGIPDVILRDHFGNYRTSLQTCIWEVETLKWLLKPGESIWDFEIQGTIRSQGVMKPFYVVTKDPVFSYLNAVDKAIYRKSVVDFINKQGIKFDPIRLPVQGLEK